MFWILLKLHPTVANIVSQVPKSDRFSVPVVYPEVGPGRGDWRFQAGNPITLVQKVSWCPCAIPLAVHCLVWNAALGCEELAG